MKQRTIIYALASCWWRFVHRRWLPPLPPECTSGSYGGPSDRTVLPIPNPQLPHSTVFDARNATPPPRFEVKAPATAPNVLIVLIDDMGFGQSSAFGVPSTCQPWTVWLKAGSATTSSIPLRSALRPGPLS